jgi:hypothetical protein
MRPLKYRLLSLILLCCSNFLYSQDYRLSKTYSQTYSLLEDKEVSIINKYGDINVDVWDIDSVRIEVIVEVSSNKESRAENLLASVDIDFKNNVFYCSAQTELIGKSEFWKDISYQANSILNKNNNVYIKYQVFLPNNANLVIKNKYGNVFLYDYYGKLNIDMAYGDLKANYISGKTILDVSYADVYIEKINQVLFNARFSEAEIAQIGFMEANTKSSKFYFDKIGELSIESSHDKYNLEEVNILKGKADFTFTKVDNLIEIVDLKIKYGDLRLRKIDPSLRSFKVNAHKSDIHLSLDYEGSYLLNIAAVAPPQIQYPIGERKKAKINIEEEGDLKKIEISWLSDDKETGAPLFFNAEEGNLYMKIK